MSSENKKAEKILVTSALPYANGPIHLGHIAGAYLPADIFVRYHRLKGSDIVFVCGSDEHGVPITLRAEMEGTTPQDVVDKYHEMNKKSFERIGISFDNFSRTTLPLHHETSQDFFTKIHDKNFLKKKVDIQFFCPHCKRFLADRFVEGKCPNCGSFGARGDQCEKCGTWLDPAKLIEPKCKLCGTTPVAKETEHYYIPLGDFQSKLEKWILKKDDWKDNVINYCKGWFDQGLEDRAVTRDLDWGVPVPLDDLKNKVLYVWFDAPIGYISSTKEWAIKQGEPDKWKEYWCNPDAKLYHFIGKDNIVFHALFFPAILMAYGGYNLPENVVANEFLNIESRKISTSQNYAIWLDDYLDKYPVDPLRYCLAAISPESKDSDFSWVDFQARNNNELADILGNFINRTLVFICEKFEGRIPKHGGLSAADKDILARTNAGLDTLSGNIEKFHVKSALSDLMGIARSANKYFNDNEPWVTIKKDRTKCANTLYTSAQIIKKLTLGMSPFLPFTSEKLRNILNIQSEFENGNWEEIKNKLLDEGSPVSKPEILFHKFDDKVIRKEIDALKSKVENAIENNGNEVPDKQEKTVEDISIDDFRKLDLRVAKIKSVSRVPNTDKLMKLEIDDGDNVRFIVSGIAEHYEEQDLVGNSIILLANLKPVKIRGEVSNGMLLAAEEGGDLALLKTDKEMKPGSRIT